MSPLYVAEGGREYPPFLMLQGDADPVVPWHQSEKLYEKLCALGYEAELVRVAGGVHENNFWTPELVSYVWDYLKERLYSKQRSRRKNRKRGNGSPVSSFFSRSADCRTAL